MSSVNRVTRRKFLRAGGAAAGIAVLTAKNYARAAGANGRLNMGVIGCGDLATREHLPKLLKMRKAENIDVVAACDVFESRATNYQSIIKVAGGAAKVCRDYPELLAIKDIDYVMVTTPEHWHAQITLDALDARKHVYCEKPLTHSIEEGQKVLAKAKSTGLKVQVGVQGMSDDSYSSAHEAIKSGKLGRVVEAQIDYVRNYVNMGHGPWRVPDKAKDGDSKPADLNWEAWVGPAPKHEWDPHRYWEWRCYRDYSGGISTDLFVHRITRIIKACGLTYPTRVVGMGGIYLWDDGRDLPDNFEMMAEYPKVEGVTPGMTVRVLGTMANNYKSEHCIRGDQATLVFNDKGWDIMDEKSKKLIESHKKTGEEDTALHHKNHHAAIRNGTPLHCPVELGFYGVVAVCMANESWFQRKMMTWDAAKSAVVSA